MAQGGLSADIRGWESCLRRILSGMGRLPPSPEVRFYHLDFPRFLSSPGAFPPRGSRLFAGVKRVISRRQPGDRPRLPGKRGLSPVHLVTGSSGQSPVQSTLMPAAATTFFQLAISRRMTVANSSGVEPMGSAPSSARIFSRAWRQTRTFLPRCLCSP